MKKIKLLIAALFLCTFVFLSGCSQKERIAFTKSETTSIENSVKESTTGTETTSDSESIGDAGKEKETSIVEINVPVELIGDLTQEDLNQICKEKGYKSITINGDGTVTYLLKKQQHEKMMKDMKSIKSYYKTGEHYNYYNKTPIDNVHVKYINAYTGEVISDTNSKDMVE